MQSKHSNALEQPQAQSSKSKDIAYVRGLKNPPLGPLALILGTLMGVATETQPTSAERGRAEPSDRSGKAGRLWHQERGSRMRRGE